MEKVESKRIEMTYPTILIRSISHSTSSPIHCPPPTSPSPSPQKSNSDDDCRFVGVLSVVSKSTTMGSCTRSFSISYENRRHAPKYSPPNSIYSIYSEKIICDNLRTNKIIAELENNITHYKCEI